MTMAVMWCAFDIGLGTALFHISMYVILNLFHLILLQCYELTRVVIHS